MHAGARMVAAALSDWASLIDDERRLRAVQDAIIGSSHISLNFAQKKHVVGRWVALCKTGEAFFAMMQSPDARGPASSESGICSRP